jgi:tetratricopeptide (TPR) repeat protein
VLEWLSAQDKWLLVLDNLDDISVAGDFLPRIKIGGGHLLITSRDPNAIGIPAEGLEVGELEVDEARALLLRRSNLRGNDVSKDVEEEAVRIVMELGCLALAIEQAAAYIREATKNIFEYLPVYSTNRKTLHSRRPRGNWHYPREVATTWLLSFEEIRKTNSEAAELLRVLAYLNPDGILVEFLEAGKAGLSERLKALIESYFLLNNALADLEKFSLIRRPNEKIISIHRLVQSVIKDEMNDDDTREYAEMILQLCDSAFPEFSQENRALCRRYQGQIVRPLFGIELRDKGTAYVMHRVGIFLHEDGMYRDSERLFHDAGIIYTKFFGDEDDNTLINMLWLGKTYLSLGRLAQAAELQEKQYQLLQRVHGDEHPLTLYAMNNLGLTYRDEGLIKEAAQLQEKALEASQRLLGNQSSFTLNAMNNLGLTYHDQGRTKEATQLQIKVLKLSQQWYGNEDPFTLSAMNNLAILYRDQGRIKEAAQMQEMVLEARQRLFSNDNPLALLAMNNLAFSYLKLGWIKEAAELAVKVLEARQRVLGPDHPDTLMSVNQLAGMYRIQGRTRGGGQQSWRKEHWKAG